MAAAGKWLGTGSSSSLIFLTQDQGSMMSRKNEISVEQVEKYVRRFGPVSVQQICSAFQVAKECILLRLKRSDKLIHEEQIGREHYWRHTEGASFR